MKNSLYIQKLQVFQQYQDEKINGAVVIDLGANITSIGVFLNNKIIFSDSMPIGGLHITSDIVRGLEQNPEDAEKIKILRINLS